MIKLNSLVVYCGDESKYLSYEEIYKIEKIFILSTTHSNMVTILTKNGIRISVDEKNVKTIEQHRIDRINEILE